GSFRIWKPDGTPLPHAATPMAVALREGREFRNENVIIERPDGSQIDVLVNIDPIRDSEGRIVGAINVFHDTTALNRAQKALRDSEQLFRTLANNAPVGIFQTDIHGDCQIVNDAWCRMAGLTPDEARGQGWVQALHPDDRERVFEEWYTAAQT